MASIQVASMKPTIIAAVAKTGGMSAKAVRWSETFGTVGSGVIFCSPVCLRSGRTYLSSQRCPCSLWCAKSGETGNATTYEGDGNSQRWREGWFEKDERQDRSRDRAECKEACDQRGWQCANSVKPRQVADTG